MISVGLFLTSNPPALLGATIVFDQAGVLHHTTPV